MIPRIRVTGDARHRGYALGEALRERIQATWALYRDVAFRDPPFDLAACGRAYFDVISAFRPEYGLEMEAMAEGADVATWQIAALNARTEIMHHTTYKVGSAAVGECTAIYFPETRVLGQNWDWLDRLEDLMVLVESEREDGHRVLQLTEPGILGKIGLNSAGVGVCLNILSGRASPPAVPVHVLLRAVLDARSRTEAREAVEKAGFGTCSHLLVGDDGGGATGIELFGDEVDFLESDGKELVHTNHYIGRERDQKGDPVLQSSLTRFARAGVLVDEGETGSVERLKTILRDGDGAPFSISAPFLPLGPLKLGTVSSIVMDLPAREMWITHGNPRDHDYQRIQLRGGTP